MNKPDSHVDTVLKSKNQGLFHFAQRGSKGSPGFKDAKSDVNKLAHGGTGNGLAVLAVGFEAFAEIMNDRIMFPGAIYRLPSIRNAWLQGKS